MRLGPQQAQATKRGARAGPGDCLGASTSVRASCAHVLPLVIMPPSPEHSQIERRRRGQIRLAASVMAATMVIWMGASFLGGRLGLHPRFAFLVDLAAIAALVWALIVTYWVWKARRDDAAER